MEGLVVSRIKGNPNRSRDVPNPHPAVSRLANGSAPWNVEDVTDA